MFEPYALNQMHQIQMHVTYLVVIVFLQQDSPLSVAAGWQYSRPTTHICSINMHKHVQARLSVCEFGVRHAAHAPKPKSTCVLQNAYVCAHTHIHTCT